MKKNDLKKVIKAIVRECVNEMLAEKYVEQCLDEMTHSSKRKTPIREAKISVPKSPPVETSRANLRETIKHGLGITEDDPMAYIFEDTARSVQHQPDVDEPGNLSEESMKKMGIFDKDWSKLI